MSSADPGEVFLNDLIAGQDSDQDLSENDDADVESHFDDDASQFSTETIDSVDAKDIYGLRDACPDDELPSEPADECNENSKFASESGSGMSKIRMEQNLAPEDATEPKMDHLPSESAGGTDETDPVDDPASEDRQIRISSRNSPPGADIPASEDAVVECVEDAGEDAVDDAGLTIVPGSGSGNLNLPPESAGATMDGWLLSSGEQPIPLLPPMIFGEDAVDDGEDAVDDAGQTTGPGAGGVNPIPQATTATGRTSTWGRSIAHDPISEGNCVFLSFDIETSGGAGIVQMSAEAVRLQLAQGTSAVKDIATRVSRVPSTFNKYVNPGKDAVWDAIGTSVHGLHSTHPNIVEASDMATVWAQFCTWIDDILFPGEVIVVVAYNGETCDLKWLWTLTQAPDSPFDLPDSFEYFLDPYRVISKMKTCKLHQEKSKLDSLSLGVVWKYINDGKNLNGAHDSLVDVKAQTDILVHPFFVPFIDRSASIKLISEIFTKTQQNHMRKNMEPTRPVHRPWQEIDGSKDVTWTPSRNDSYDGPSGGPNAGPSLKMKSVAHNHKSLCDLFLVIIPLSFFIKVAEYTTKYCYKDWVVEKLRPGRDNNTTKKKYFKDVPATEGGVKTPGRRHRADQNHSKNKQYIVTAGYVICWIAILILQGAHFGSNKRASSKMWRRGPYGVNIPYIQNTMTAQGYEFMRRFIHFSDNSKRKPKTVCGYDPLFKVRYPLDVLMKGMRGAWLAGKHVTIDESMIRYMGRAVTYVQYMPAKPIKHGIKVFALCCGFTGVLLSFIVYTGGEAKTDNTTLNVCDKLCISAGITKERGRVLYTDNYYTSVKLAKHMFEKYGWTIVGTISATDKKSRQDEDIPFLKLSNGARDKIERGWYREAVLKMKNPVGKVYYIQCTTWRDKKQVCFLSNCDVGSSKGCSVFRHVKGKKARIEIPGPRAQAQYVTYMNAVDRNDRDSADYSTSIRTNRYYIRIFCWVLDRVIHTLYVVVCFLAKSNIGSEKWKKYLTHKSARHDFQIDLGLELLSYGIAQDWDGKSKRPDYMRSGEFVPCGCEQCYFCINGFTTGVAHATKKRKAEIQFKCGSRLRTKKCTDFRVNLEKGGAYCKMCYRNQDKSLSRKQKLKKCNSSRMGCVQCQETICEKCWKSGYDKH